MASAAVMDQMSFADEDTECERFASNPLARVGALTRKCKDCFRDIQAHARTAVSEEDVMRVIEGNEAIPSLISGEPTAGLYMGGYKAAINEKFLRDAAVGLVVNTAGGLQAFFPTFRPAPLHERLGVKMLQLEWMDSDTQEIRADELDETTAAIASTLQDGRSVLVHCAQGRSRSGTVVVAHISRSQGLAIDGALSLVQSKRSMAQPNANFMRQLASWHQQQQQ